jgi:hypothetical protein
VADAAHPPCDPPARFGYCPATNTVYIDPAYARTVYFSRPRMNDGPDSSIRLTNGRRGDFALGSMLAVAWGMAARHELARGSLDGAAALRQAVCFTGGYARAANAGVDAKGHIITLTPEDLDEATWSMLAQVGRPQAFGARGIDGLERFRAFERGYRQGIASC